MAHEERLAELDRRRAQARRMGGQKKLERRKERGDLNAEERLDLLQSLQILTNALRVFRTRCVEGITADPDRCRQYADRSMALATALNPYIGYAAAAEVVKESVRTGKGIPEIVLEKELLSPEQLKDVLDPFKMTEPGIPGRAT